MIPYYFAWRSGFRRSLERTQADLVERRISGIAKCSNSYYARGMELISVKLPPALRAKVAAEARRRNVSQSTIVRESLEQVLTGPASRGQASCADVAGNLIGVLRSGRRDLSRNKKLLADAIASDARRGRKRRR